VTAALAPTASPAPAQLARKADVLRDDVLRMIARVGTGHPGSSLSCLELLTCLYYRVMRFRPADPAWDDRDRLVLSKGHAAPALYAILIDLGVVPAPEGLRLREVDSLLQGHPDRRLTPGVEVSSGSLGQGSSIAVGIALGLRKRGLDARVFLVLGDGETQEGQVWEALMAAAHFGLDNLTAIFDCNGHQHDGRVADIMDLEPLVAKLRAFRWSVQEVDGHDCEAIVDVLEGSAEPGQPSAVVARTVKGHGVAFMEDQTDWHSVTDAARLAAYVQEREDASGLR
jgi:transketolase